MKERRAAGTKTVVTREGKEKSGTRTRSAWALVRAFFGLLRAHRGAVAFSLATLTIATAIGLVPPAATKIAVDNVFLRQPLPEPLARWLPDAMSREPLSLLAALAIAVLVLSIFRAVVHLAGRWQATRVTKLLQSDLRRRVFRHAVRLPLERVYRLKAGGAASLLREDAGGVPELLFSLVYNPWRATIQLVGVLTILAFTDWRLLLGSLLLLPAVFLTHRTWIARIRPVFRDIRAQRSDVDAHATEAFSGMRVVRGFARERSETARFTGGNHLMARQELLAWWWSRGIEFAWELLVPTASALLLFYGGWQVVRGTLTPGDLILFLTYLVMLLGPLEALATSATALQTNLAGFDRVLDLLAETQEMPDRAGARAIEVSAVRGHLDVDDVHFRYPGSNEDVLRGVSFSARPGEMIALIGASGAGKTTLCNLIARFFDPTAGAIRLDGVDLRDLRLEDYRRLLGIVEQDVFLFDGTIAENIAYGRRDASTAAIADAARAAAISEWIEGLPERYGTLIGERGVRLSGGQRQRVAIARAVLADPRILILDEATSNLDTASERLIQDAIASLVRSRTTFVIAHRLSTIQHADRIVVLQGGRVIEQGSHEALLAHGGVYRDMVAAQTARPEHAPAPSDHDRRSDPESSTTESSTTA